MSIHRPKVLCLHGAGSSAAIFKVQSRKVLELFRDRFEFVFAEAPFPSLIGPDMQPFSDSGPFYRWHVTETCSGSLDDSSDDVENERGIVRDYLRELLTGDDWDDFVGVMGFSNGASVASSLILERSELAQLWGRCPNFRFALLFNGTYPPAPLLPADIEWSRTALDSIDPSFISIHVLGLKDPYLLQSRKLLQNVYQPLGRNECVEFTGHHHMPIRPGDVKRLSMVVARWLHEGVKLPEVWS